MTPDERAAVRQILALPDWPKPWDFAEGFATAAEYFADIRIAGEHHTRRLPPLEKTTRRSTRTRNRR